MAQVTLTGIHKVYPGDVTAVKDVNLSIGDREFMVLVGPSGCGKSTTMRMIAGLEDITQGELSIDGRVMNQVAPKDRDIAMVFQNYALYPHMTVFDNMGFSLRIRRAPKEEIKKRVHEAAEILDLTKYLDRQPKALSGGQRQRVALGRAIVRQPKVFLFDEPLSNLDAKMRVQMRVEIGKLHEQLDATMIYVTHDQTEAMTMGDRICVMKDGEVQQVDVPMELYRRPANAFVGSFIGLPPMNMIDGAIKITDGHPSFVGDGLELKLPDGWRSSLAAADGRAVTFGIRPEDLAPAAGGDADMTATVDVVEPMGSESYVYIQAAGQQITARFPPLDDLKAGGETGLKIDMAKVKLFDRESGDAIPHPE